MLMLGAMIPYDALHPAWKNNMDMEGIIFFIVRDIIFNFIHNAVDYSEMEGNKL